MSNKKLDRLNMTAQEVYQYRESVRIKYQNASRTEKGLILSELCDKLQLNRKYAIRMLNSTSSRPFGQAKTSNYSDHEVSEILVDIWRISGQPCSRRLHKLIPAWLPSYEKHYGAINDNARDKIQKISPATIDRVFSKKQLKSNCELSSLPTLKVRSLAKDFWTINGPGFLDLSIRKVKNSIYFTLLAQDVFSGWRVARPLRSLESAILRDATKQLTAEFPFPVIACHLNSKVKAEKSSIAQAIQEACPSAGFSSSNRNCLEIELADINFDNFEQLGKGLSLIALLNNYYIPHIYSGGTIKMSYETLLDSEYLEEIDKHRIKQLINFISPIEIIKELMPELLRPTLERILLP